MEKNEVLQKSEKWLNTRIHKIRRVIGFPHNILQIIDFPTKPFEITTCAKTPMK